MKICNQCGNQLNDTAKFCKQCGTKVEIDNVTIVEEDESVASEAQTESVVHEENRSEPEVAVNESTSESSTNFVDTVGEVTFDYFNFLKETLISPTSVFDQVENQWVLGAVGLTLYAVIAALFSDDPFIGMFFTNIIMQLLIVGVLFLLNNFVLLGDDTYLDVLGKYGGLFNIQIVLLLLMSIFTGERIVFFLSSVFIFSYLNIINLYIFKSQNSKPQKIDRYYQLLISYAILIVASYVIFFLLTETFG